MWPTGTRAASQGSGNSDSTRLDDARNGQATSAAPSTRARAAVVTATLAGVVLLLLRRPEGLFAPTLWAEDGPVLIRASVELGWAAFWEPYAGQLWVGSRLLAGGATLLPAGLWPAAAYVLACTAAALALAVVLQRRAAVLFGDLRIRIALFLVLILQPSVWEIQGNLANVHVWLAMSLLVLLALPAPRTAWGRIGESGYLAVSCLTGFLGVVLLPVALWRAATGRNRYFIWRLAVVATCGAGNLVATWAVRTPAGDLPIERVGFAGVLVVKRAAGGMILGENGMALLWPGGVSLFVIPALAILGTVSYLALSDRFGPSPWWIVSGLAWIALGVSSLPAEQLGLGTAASTHYAGRYVNLLITAFILVIARAIAFSRGRGRSAAQIAAAAMLAAVVTGFFVADDSSGQPRPLDPQELAAFEVCLEGVSGVCTLPISPEGWQLQITPD